MTSNDKVMLPPKDINNFDEFLSAIKTAKDELTEHLKALAQDNSTRNSDIEYLIFRGQPVDKDLYPRIGRPEYKRDNRKSGEIEKAIFEEFKRLSIPLS
jgi:hypothetical protein